MSYDIRNRYPPPYGTPLVASTSSSYLWAGSSPTGVRPPYLHPNPPSSLFGVGIRVMLKPEYHITPPPQLIAPGGEVPRSQFRFDFGFEKKLLAEAEKDGFQNWSRIAADNQPRQNSVSSFSGPATSDPAVDKYVASGLGREAVSFAFLNYGDNPVKVCEFVKGYNLLREMGFTSKNVAEVLAMYDNDAHKALAYLLNNPS